MVLDPARELGRMLGQMSRDQQKLAENIAPADSGSALQLQQTEYVEIALSVTATKKVYDSTAFIPDHPVQGELDSAVYELDGGYDAAQEEEIHSVSF